MERCAIDGTVEGNIRCTGKIVIGPEGKIHGNLSCTHACLHGTIIGDAYVKEELTLKANCVMQGNIYTTKLEIFPSGPMTIFPVHRIFPSTVPSIRISPSMEQSPLMKNSP